MSRPFRAAALAVIGVAGACAAGWVGHTCLGEAACATVTAIGIRSITAGVALAGLTSIALIVLRAGWLLTAARRAVTALPYISPPDALRAACDRVGLRASVACVRDDGSSAFCSGAARPRIVVTDTLVERLRPQELDATLVHEAAHARRRDPLRHALRRATAEVLFYMPVVAWWARRQLAEAELAADRAAITRVGPGPLAGALWMVAVDERGGMAVPGPRVRQLLGGSRSRALPTASDLASSVAGLGLAVAAGLCLSQVFRG